jgi:hypothetical protein
MKTENTRILLFMTVGIMLSTNVRLTRADAVCLVDQYASGETCVGCPANSMSVAESIGIESCKCMWNYWFDGSACILCAANSISLMGSTNISECNCMNHYYQDELTCVMCPTGSWSEIDTQAIQECFCEPGMYMTDAYDACTECPHNKTSSWYLIPSHLVQGLGLLLLPN